MVSLPRDLTYRHNVLSENLNESQLLLEVVSLFATHTLSFIGLGVYPRVINTSDFVALYNM